MAAVVAELAERRVVVAVTHRDELLAHADHHLVLAAADASPVEVIPGATSLPGSPRPAGEEGDR